jgi:hypothetical protein
LPHQAADVAQGQAIYRLGEIGDKEIRRASLERARGIRSAAERGRDDRIPGELQGADQSCGRLPVHRRGDNKDGLHDGVSGL